MIATAQHLNDLESWFKVIKQSSTMAKQHQDERRQLSENFIRYLLTNQELTPVAKVEALYIAYTSHRLLNYAEFVDGIGAVLRGKLSTF